MKRAHSDITPNFPVTHKIKLTGENQKVETDQKLPYLKFKASLKISCSRKDRGELTGYFRFFAYLKWALNCPPWQAKSIIWLVFLKTLKPFTFLKLCAHFL